MPSWRNCASAIAAIVPGPCPRWCPPATPCCWIPHSCRKMKSCSASRNWCKASLSPEWRLEPRHDSGHFYLDTIDAGTAGDVKSLTVFLTPGHIADHLRNLDRPEMFALRGNDPDSARAGTPDVAFLVHPQTVGRTHHCLGGGVEKDAAISDRSVGLYSIAHP